MKKILVVDNDPFFLKLMKVTLSTQKHQVITAQGGLSALDILKTFTPDFIFIDLVMPNIDGKKLCKIIKGIGRLKNAYLIILSAISAEKEIHISELEANIIIAKGPRNEMAQHILFAIDQPDLASLQCSKGEVIGIENIWKRGITEELLSVKKQHEILLNRMTDGIVEITSDRRIVYANPTALALIQRTEEKLLGMGFHELFSENDRRRICQLLETTDEKFKKITEHSPVCLNSRQVTLDILPIETEKGEGFKCIVIINDVTERKNVQQALQNSEFKFRSLFELSPQAISRSHYETGKIVDVNQKFCELFKISREEILELNPVKLGFYSQASRQHFLNVLKESGEVHGLEMEFKARDDSKFKTLMFAKLIQMEGTTYILTIFHDITDRKELEAQLRQAQKMEAIGTLAGGIAHNFNNLLMGIQGYASLALMEIDPNHPNKNKLKNIEKLVQSGSNLTSQLLGYAREGKYKVQSSNLNQLVKETADTFNLTRKEIHVHQELDENLLNVRTDQGQIEQVLFNLLVNAADAMPLGGNLFLKTINITHANMLNKPYKAAPGNYVLLTVRDTGSGMEKKTLERIFEPFFTTKGLSKGTGLGLASVYGIVKAHGGYIDVFSEKGQGTTFEVSLPAFEKEPAQEKAVFNELFDGIETVLLIDDEQMIIDVGKEMLTQLGYKVLTATSGIEALDVYRRNQDTIDLLVLDMIMPDMEGGATYDKIKDLNPNVKVLLASGYSIDGRASEIMKRGCNGFIQKPFNMKELSDKIRNILDEKELSNGSK
ncbi:MAG: response regulator [Deltaproteobacteria bacterium]|nr:response regulator [Deltaproteobacteria bacterium]